MSVASLLGKRMGNEMGHYGLQHTRARLAGNRQALERKRARISAQVAKLTEQERMLSAEIQETTAQLEVIEAAMRAVYEADLPPVEPRETVPKQHRAAWGGVTRGIFATLRLARGKALNTYEVADTVSRQLGLTFDSQAETVGFRRAVARRLQHLAWEGRIARLHDLQSNEVGLWQLKASPA